MATALGGFSGKLDDKLQLNDAVSFIPTKDAFTASQFRVKVMDMQWEDGEGSVSAVIQGTENTLERMIYPKYGRIWDRRRVPKVPDQLSTGHVKDAAFPLAACLPEIEHCRDRRPTQPLPIDPPVSSIGFVVRLSLTFKDLRPGMQITGIVALSDE